MLNNNYDIIIIGSGLGGLSAGAILAQAGKKVLLIEQHNKPGGYATNFKRGNFIFDASLHNIGPIMDNEVVSHVFRQLNIYNTIEFIPFQEFQKVIFPEHSLIIKKGLDSLINDLTKNFPSEENGIKAVFKVIKDISTEFDEINTNQVKLNNFEETFPSDALKYQNLTIMAEKTIDELVDDHINDPRLKGIITNLWWLHGVTPSELASIVYAMALYWYYEYAGGYIKGTSQALSDAIAEKILQNGGKILFNTEVNKIILDNEKVKSVKTVKGNEFFAPVIVSNANPIDTFNFIEYSDENNPLKLVEKTKKKFNKMAVSLSAIQLFLGLDIDPADLGMEHHAICYYPMYDQNKLFREAMDGNYENMFFNITNFAAFQPELKNKKQFSVSIMSLDHINNWEMLSKEEYKDKKEKVSNIIIKKINKLIPGISDHIVYKELATPITMQRYTRNPEGTIYGFSHYLTQSGIFRPTNITPLHGLYLTGAYTYPGAGFNSVLISGFRAAKIILKKSG